jgi:DNA polymerase I
MVLEWYNEPKSIGTYVGGFVMEPTLGLHEDVVVFDFSSMYPNIIVSSNISSETVRVVNDMHEIGELSDRYGLPALDSLERTDIVIRSDERYICLVIDNTLGLISRRPDGISKQVMKYLMEARNKLEDRSSSQAWSLKIGANSYYGALGSNTSGLGCRFGAAAVTALGRTMIENLIAHMRSLGVQVIYGDTDSVFVKVSSTMKARGKTIRIISDDLIRSFQNTLVGTIYDGAKLNFERTYKRLILLRPKMYYGTCYDTNEATIKGMVSKRRDRPNISRTIASDVCRLICSTDNPIERNRKTSVYVYGRYRDLVNGRVRMKDCMLETKEDGKVVWKFKSHTGSMVTVEKGRLGSVGKDYPSVEWVLKSIENSVENVLRVCGMMSFKRMIEYQSGLSADIEDIL